MAPKMAPTPGDWLTATESWKGCSLTFSSIIAVHGLGANRDHAWVRKADPSVGVYTDVNWLKDLLPATLRASSPGIVSRVFCFNYTSRWLGRELSKQRLTLIANHLLDDIDKLRRSMETNDARNRPLILLGHSFGGLVIEKAIVRASVQKSTFQHLVDLVGGIVLFGTPHQGSKTQPWGSVIARAAQTIHLGESGLLMEVAEENMEIEDMVNDFARIMMQKGPETVLVFFENQKSNYGRRVLSWLKWEELIVSESSARLTGFPSLSLDSDHFRLNKFSNLVEPNYKKVSTNIHRIAEMAPSILQAQKGVANCGNKHYMVFRQINPLFTGRLEEIARLRHALCLSDPTTENEECQRIFVISGMGGAGKSEVALNFARKCREDFWGIFWIDAANINSIKRGFANIAKMCNLLVEDLEDIKSWLTNTSNRWLLVLDNADDVDMDYSKFVPAGDGGSILITSRNPSVGRLATVGTDQYERLKEEDAVSLMLRACDFPRDQWPSHQQAGKEVVRMLGFHALAILQAGAFVQQKLSTLSEYPRHFRNQRQRLLQHRPNQIQSIYGSVYATFEVSAKHMEDSDQQDAKDACALLSFLAFVNSTKFPQQMFEKAWQMLKRIQNKEMPCAEDCIWCLSDWHVSHIPSFMREGPDQDLDTISIRQASSLLAAFSIVKINDKSRDLTMHPLTQAWARDRISLSDSKIVQKNVLAVIAMSIEGPFVEDLSWHEQLQPQVEAYLATGRQDISEREFGVVQSLFRFGCLLHWMRSDALENVVHTIEHSNHKGVETQFFNKSKVDFLHAISDINLGKVNAAVKRLELMVEQKRLNPEFENQVGLERGLAQAYLHSGDIVQAVKLLEHVVDIQSQTLQVKDPDRLFSECALGVAYQCSGDTAQAMTILEHVVNIRSQTQGAEHPDRLASEYELGNVYFNSGNTAQAVKILQHVVKMQTQTLRVEDLYRLRSEHVLARAYLSSGDIVQVGRAVKMLERVVQIQSQIQSQTLKAGSRFRLLSEFQLLSKGLLAQGYLSYGDVAQAVTMLEDVVNVQSQTLTAEDPELLQSESALAEAYLSSRDVAQAAHAVEMLERVVNIRSRTLKIESPSRLASEHLLAVGYLNSSRDTARAVKMLEHVVNIRSQTLKAEHLDRLKSEHELARAYLKTAGNTAAAIKILVHVVNIRSQTLNAEDPNRLASEQLVVEAFLSWFAYDRDADSD